MSQPPYPPGQQGGYPPPPADPPLSPPSDAPPPPMAYPAPSDGNFPLTGPDNQPMPGYGTPPPKKSRALKIALVVLGVMTLLCAGTAAVGYFAFGDKVKNAIESTRITLITPETLGGRARATDPSLSTVADQISAELKGSVPEAKTTVAAIYGDVARQDLLMVAGAAGVVPDPQRQLDQLIKEMETGLKLKDAADIPPGPLGGKAKCGNANAQGVPIAICAWADAGSAAMIGMFFKTADDLQAEFVALRGAIEQKSG